MKKIIIIEDSIDITEMYSAMFKKLEPYSGMIEKVYAHSGTKGKELVGLLVMDDVYYIVDGDLGDGINGVDILKAMTSKQRCSTLFASFNLSLLRDASNMGVQCVMEKKDVPRSMIEMITGKIIDEDLRGI